MGSIIAILNQKGGVGKTTTAINMGVYLAKAGKKVLLVDFDPQGNATSGLGLSKESAEVTSYDVLFHPSDIVRAIQETPIGGLNLLPANRQLAAAEVELVDQSEREIRLRKALTGLDYDIVLIDCPPSLSLLTVNALAAADKLLIPVQAEYYAMEGLAQLLSVFQQVRLSLNPDLEIMGFVITMYDKRNALSGQVRKQLETQFDKKVFKTIIPRNVRLAEAPSHGKSIAEYDKWSKGARAYKQFSREVLSNV